jgi:hypothetical protein
MPFFIDVEAAIGVTLAADFFNKLGTADLLVISFAEQLTLIRRHSKNMTGFRNSHSRK